MSRDTFKPFCSLFPLPEVRGETVNIFAPIMTAVRSHAVKHKPADHTLIRLSVQSWLHISKPPEYIGSHCPYTKTSKNKFVSDDSNKQNETAISQHEKRAGSESVWTLQGRDYLKGLSSTRWYNHKELLFTECKCQQEAPWWHSD